MSLIRYCVATALLTTTAGFAAAVAMPAFEVAQNPNTPSPNVLQRQRPVAPPAPQPSGRNWPVWQRGDSLNQDGDWAESNFTIEEDGRKLLLSSQGSVEIQSVQIQLADGLVRTLPVRSQPYGNGLYLLLDFGGIQTVQTVRVVARATASRSAYSVQLWR